MEQTEECVVYKITNQDKFYIGITNNFNRRMTEHKRVPPPKMIIDIKYYDDFYKEIIFQGTRKDCLNKEIELIAKEKPYYNTSAGGEGGTGLFGEDIWNSILTKKDVENIRELYSQGYTQKELQDIYGVSSIISNIVLGKRWKKADGKISEPIYGGENHTLSVLSDKQVEEIRIRCSVTLNSYFIISKDYPVGTMQIFRIANGENRKNQKGPILGIDYLYRGELLTGPTLLISNIKEEDVISIRIRCRDTDDTYREISKDYPISQHEISNIARAICFKDILGPIAGKDYKDNRKLNIITKEQVIDIRNRCKDSTDSYETIAKYIGCIAKTISDIAIGLTHKYDGGPILYKDYADRPKRPNNANTVLTDILVEEIRLRCYKTKDTYVIIAKDYPVKNVQISRIAKGERWKEAPGPILGKDYMKRGEGSE